MSCAVAIDVDFSSISKTESIQLPDVPASESSDDKSASENNGGYPDR